MTEKLLIAVAEDDADMRELLGSSLRNRGFDIDECSDGAELLAHLKQARAGARVPDLVISDVQMPGATGLEVLGWLTRRLPEVPCILITAFGDWRTHRRAHNLGARVVIDKPFDLRVLHEFVHSVLADSSSTVADHSS